MSDHQNSEKGGGQMGWPAAFMLAVFFVCVAYVLNSFAGCAARQKEAEYGRINSVSGSK